MIGRPLFSVVGAAAFALSVGCRGSAESATEATSVKASEALALAMLDRIGEAERRAAERPPDPAAWPHWEIVIFQASFHGIDEGLDLDPAFRRALQSYFDANEPFEVPADLSLAAQREGLAPIHEDMARRYEAFASFLLARAEADEEDVAARGLLAVTAGMHKAAMRSCYLEFPRAALLDRVLLDGAIGIGTPPCALLITVGAGGDASGRTACPLPANKSVPLATQIQSLRRTWRREIYAIDGQSTWLEVGDRLESRRWVNIRASSLVRLPQSTSRIPDEVGTNVVLSPHQLCVDGRAIASWDDPVDWRDAAGETMREAAVTAHMVSTRNPKQKPSRNKWLIQADADLPWTTVEAMMSIAADHEFIHPLVVVSPITAQPLLHQSHVMTLPVRYLAVADAQQRTSFAQAGPSVWLAIEQDGFELGDGTALPTDKSGAFPFSALNTLLAAMPRADHTQGPPALFVVPSPDTPWQRVITTLDAAREHCRAPNEACAPLYPDVWLVGNAEAFATPTD